MYKRSTDDRLMYHFFFANRCIQIPCEPVKPQKYTSHNALQSIAGSIRLTRRWIVGKRKKGSKGREPRLAHVATSKEEAITKKLSFYDRLQVRNKNTRNSTEIVFFFRAH